MGKRAESGLKLLRYLYGQPVVGIDQVAKELKVTHQTANALVKQFEEADILLNLSGNRRNQVFYFLDYLKIFIRSE